VSGAGGKSTSSGAPRWDTRARPSMWVNPSLSSGEGGFLGGEGRIAATTKRRAERKAISNQRQKAPHPTTNQPTNQPTKTMESQVPFRTEAARGDAPPGAWLCCGAVAAFSSAYPDGHRGRILFRERPVGVRQLFFFFPLLSLALSPFLLLSAQRQEMGGAWMPGSIRMRRRRPGQAGTKASWQEFLHSAL